MGWPRNTSTFSPNGIITGSCGASSIAEGRAELAKQANKELKAHRAPSRWFFFRNDTLKCQTSAPKHKQEENSTRALYGNPAASSAQAPTTRSKPEPMRQRLRF